MNAFFKDIDLFFAKKLLGSHSTLAKESAALAYLFAASRQGHHCVSVSEQQLVPCLEDVLNLSEKEESVFQAVIEGFTLFDEGYVNKIGLNTPLRPVIKENNHYYLQKTFFFEASILEALKRQLSASLNISIEREEVQGSLAKWKENLNHEQQQAIIEALVNPVHLITGGPGTGKSYTIKYLLKVYKDLCQKRGMNSKVLLASPTGKATSSLKEKLADELTDGMSVSTLHQALDLSHFKKSKSSLDRYDLIIIDEGSMVDLFVWRSFFDQLKEGTRVVLVGDHRQLPPVEGAMLFDQLMSFISTSALQACLRVESSSLLLLAEAICQQDEKKVFEFLKEERSEICFFEYEEEKELSALQEINVSTFYAEKDLKKMILTPLSQGPWGVESINEQFYKRYVTREKALSIPLIITKTDYALDLYNGDIGWLKIENEKEKVEINGREIPYALIKESSFAYALSIHKSQGSEYEEVLLFLPSGSEFFGKEILYTAVTRAKKKITIIARKGILSKILQKSDRKNSALAERFFKT